MSSEWSPPDEESQPESQVTQGEAQPLGTFGEVLGESWQSLRANPWPAVVGFLGSLVCIFAATFVMYLALFMIILAGTALVEVANLAPEDPDSLVSLLSFLSVLVMYPLLLMVMVPAQGVMLRGGLMTARGEPLDLALLFSGLWRMATTGVLMVVVILLAVTPAVFLLYIPALYLGLRWSVAFYYLLDTELSALDCMRASWRATEGKVLNLFGKNLLLSLIAFFGILFTCYLGIFLIVPLQMVFGAVIYGRLSGRTGATA
jgi:uncharacterized membrane protein